MIEMQILNDEQPIEAELIAEEYKQGYDKGYTEGHEKGYDEGYDKGFNAAGENAYNMGLNDGSNETKRQIFGAWQNKGKRTNYAYGCYCVPMIDNYFYPQYDIKATDLTAMFRGCTAVDATVGFDLVKRLNECGVTLDTSDGTALTLIFAYAQICTLPTIDFSAGTKAASIANTFTGNTRLHTIEKVIFKEVFTYANTFDSCTRLKNLTAGGTIAHSINFSWSPLTAESAKSLILCLKDYAGTDDEFVNSITFSETTLALLEAEGATSPNEDTWLEYVASIGWNI